MDNLRQVRNCSKCNRCQWGDQCGSDGGGRYCEDYTPFLEGDIEYILKNEYNTDLRDRIDDYNNLLDEMAGDA